MRGCFEVLSRYCWLTLCNKSQLEAFRAYTTVRRINYVNQRRKSPILNLDSLIAISFKLGAMENREANEPELYVRKLNWFCLQLVLSFSRSLPLFQSTVYPTWNWINSILRFKQGGLFGIDGKDEKDCGSFSIEHFSFIFRSFSHN